MCARQLYLCCVNTLHCMSLTAAADNWLITVIDSQICHSAVHDLRGHPCTQRGGMICQMCTKADKGGGRV